MCDTGIYVCSHFDIHIQELKAEVDALKSRVSSSRAQGDDVAVGQGKVMSLVLWSITVG